MFDFHQLGPLGRVGIVVAMCVCFFVSMFLVNAINEVWLMNVVSSRNFVVLIFWAFLRLENRCKDLKKVKFGP